MLTLRRSLATSVFLKNADVNQSDNNFYKVLNVPDDASRKEIKEAYFLKSKKLHPDMNDSVSAKEDYKKVRQAYEVLIDAKLKAKYDAKLKELKNPKVKQSLDEIIQEVHKKPDEEFRQESDLFDKIFESRWRSISEKEKEMMFQQHYGPKEHDRMHPEHKSYLRFLNFLLGNDNLSVSNPSSSEKSVQRRKISLRHVIALISTIFITEVFVLPVLSS